MNLSRHLPPLAMALGLIPAATHAQQPQPDTTAGPDAREISENQATSVASITYDRGIVTSPGRLTLEPSISYAHSNSTVVAVEGYTVIPALLVGLINISEVQRDIFTGSLAMKYGFTSRFEAGVRVPYLIINEDLREREVFQGTPVDTIRESSGEGLGDVEVSARYQLNDGIGGWPYLIGSLRAKTPTGEGPYDVDQRVLFDSNNNPIGVELSERPTGSGFWSVEPGLSFIYPTDPAVLFGNLSYVWTIKEDKGWENGLTVDPGDVIRFGFGMGFAFNERTSFSLGYDHSIIGDTDYERDISLLDTRFDRIHVGSLTFGLSHRLTSDTSLSTAVSVGVTDNAPNTEITLRLPVSL
ncbi:Putative MetA-pathway of phenol degradation [Marinobacter daqiaonensis]|uniref:Putative MetA-pathway of phenol degradation n=1 Tax=Marinobacter daqiaonensis TaxID=650891 RepID=A0A1I6JV66_9GAMM|nr:transporter [Marinobacter daqiaonensis]SFR82430.1 Putative MetA-pathway of phenol degradation [Marinobacter daqiaonensis]